MQALRPKRCAACSPLHLNHCLLAAVICDLCIIVYFRESSVFYLKFSKSDMRFVRFGVSDFCSVLASDEYP